MHTRLRLLLALILVVIAAYLAEVRLPDRPQIPELDGFYKVMQVHDGDTIVVLLNGKRVSVRLIGIDSPEVETRYTHAECYGSEASAAAHRLLDGKMVRLQTDPSQNMYDVYDRLLAYVYVPTDASPGGVLANQYLVQEGFAREYTYKDPYIHAGEFKASEADARQNGRGMWGACHSDR